MRPADTCEEALKALRAASGETELTTRLEGAVKVVRRWDDESEAAFDKHLESRAEAACPNGDMCFMYGICRMKAEGRPELCTANPEAP